ncbi:hypothetical protein JTB14_026015 [Gonioctena quinquepunctata]|nr:hypothetical protein JTB14_026015 [Gonioctena quinquepunctata]
MISLTESKPVLVENPKKNSNPRKKKPDEKEPVEQKVETVSEPKPAKTEEDIKERIRNAVSIISSALDKEGTRKYKSRPYMMRKPPVLFGVSGRSTSGNEGMLTSPLSPPQGPKPFVKQNFEPVDIKQVPVKSEPVDESQTSSAEITLKSATLPRKKTTKAEIQLHYPVPEPASMGVSHCHFLLTEKQIEKTNYSFNTIEKHKYF